MHMLDRDIHWKPAHELSSAGAASEVFAVGSSIDSMLKRSVAKSTFGGSGAGATFTAGFVVSTGAAAGSIFCCGFITYYFVASRIT